MAATKIRINELARELSLDWKRVADVLEKQFNFSVKSHSSTIEADLADKVRNALKPGASQPLAAAAKPVTPNVSSPQPAKNPEPKAAAKPATLMASRQQPKPPAPAVQPVAVEKPAKPIAASIVEKPAAAKVETFLPEIDEEDDALLEILTAPPEEEPFSEIAKTIERHQKPDHVRTILKKSVDADKPIIPSSHKKDDHHHVATGASVATAPVKTAMPIAAAAPELPTVTIPGPLAIVDLAVILKKRETELIRHLFMKGVMVTVNQTMQVEDAMALAAEMGFEVQGPEAGPEIDQYAAPELKIRQAKGNHLKPRAPVVSIMGHVDHGKTSLLDAIRESRHNITDSEAGGITQSIGAYSVEKDGHKVVFIDTPGHEAFTAMRMRGAQATDIAILVVAADDGVMPQTIEAINHAKAAKIPIIVAVNKIDKPGADPDRVMVQLADHGLNPEKWGGDTIMVEVSALQKLGLDDLLEMIILVSDLQELKADTTVPAEGVVIEARVDKGKGAVATVLVQNGTLHVGENILMKFVGGRVRALINDSGERIKSAGPSTPVEIVGLGEVPRAGDTFVVVRNDKEFKRLVQQNATQDKLQRQTTRMTSAPGLMVTEKNTQDFNLIIKADTQGSVEAVSAAILRLATEEVSVKVIHAGTGDISEADVLLASASNAIIIAFNVREEANAQRAAQDQGIRIMTFDVIYHVTEEMEKLMLGLLSPETEEQEVGVAEVRQLFSFGKTTIAGCYVTEGKIVRNTSCRVLRNGKEVFKGVMNNLKRFKEDAREVAQGYECGISFDKFNDLQAGDMIHAYTMKEIERTSL